jgi:hypothetical protein
MNGTNGKTEALRIAEKIVNKKWQTMRESTRGEGSERLHLHCNSKMRLETSSTVRRQTIDQGEYQ